ncbi:hypothetical protein ACFVUH_23350 [Kitasatospora sp. NPDC058032]|uniref:hypothetical protein n=1 Tax=Kitasatospora sp. NPDC058032 TaxID=3346307 RepID=UPI0036DD0A54
MYEIWVEILKGLAGELPASLITAGITAGITLATQKLRKKTKKTKKHPVTVRNSLAGPASGEDRIDQ